MNLEMTDKERLQYVAEEFANYRAEHVDSYFIGCITGVVISFLVMALTMWLSK